MALIFALISFESLFLLVCTFNPISVTIYDRLLWCLKVAFMSEAPENILTGYNLRIKRKMYTSFHLLSQGNIKANHFFFWWGGGWAHLVMHGLRVFLFSFVKFNKQKHKTLFAKIPSFVKQKENIYGNEACFLECQVLFFNYLKF